MNSETTTEQIKEKVDKKPGFMEGIIDKALAQANLPRCDLCHGIIATGAMPYQDQDGKFLNVCMKCVYGAIRYYITAKKERLTEG